MIFIDVLYNPHQICKHYVTMQRSINAAQPIFLQRAGKCATEKELEDGCHHGLKSSCWFRRSKVWIWLQLTENKSALKTETFSV